MAKRKQTISAEAVNERAAELAASTSPNNVIAAAASGASTKSAKASRSGKKVAVGCKLPHGLQLRIFTMVEASEAILGGGSKTVKVAQQMGDIVRLKGPLVPPGKFPLFPIVHGAAITHNVDAEFFALWLEQNSGSDVVKNGLVFAHEGSDYVEGEAAEKEKVRTGLEPLDPANLPKGTRVETMSAK